MPAEFRSNLGAFIGASERAQMAGLVAAAELYLGAMREELQEGYTSGDFVTGAAANSVSRTSPEPAPDGFEIAVGSNLDYVMFWEVGHQNLFTGKHERVEKWVPKMVEMRDELTAAVAAEIRAVDGAL